MCRSAIYAINTNAGTEIPAGGIYPLTRVVRRFGCALGHNGEAITIKSPGYYKVSGVFTVSPTAIGQISATLMLDGQPVPGATATVTAPTETPEPLTIDAIVRVGCCEMPSELTVQLTAAAEMVNANMSVLKI